MLRRDAGGEDRPGDLGIAVDVQGGQLRPPPQDEQDVGGRPGEGGGRRGVADRCRRRRGPRSPARRSGRSGARLAGARCDPSRTCRGKNIVTTSIDPVGRQAAVHPHREAGRLLRVDQVDRRLVRLPAPPERDLMREAGPKVQVGASGVGVPQRGHQASAPSVSQATNSARSAGPTGSAPARPVRIASTRPAGARSPDGGPDRRAPSPGRPGPGRRGRLCGRSRRRRRRPARVPRGTPRSEHRRILSRPPARGRGPDSGERGRIWQTMGALAAR